MFKFIRAKGPHTTAERQKLQKELFSYRRTLQHGFPNKPTALAWDSSLRLIGIGTANGAIKVFGKPGVEFYGQHQNSIAVTRLVFLPNVGRIISLCDDNSLHLWEVNKNSLVEVRTQSLEGKLKKISSICVESSGNHLLLGTEGGNIYLLDLRTFTITPDIIYQDIVLQNIPEDYKLNPGAVEAVSEQPGEPSNILIGYNRGLIVLWDRSDNIAIQKFVSNQQLESICWHEDGQSFTSSHNDGSYVIWDINEDISLNDPVSTYGPFPCKAIPKIIRREFGDSFLTVFSGGLPRASYSDKYTVTAVHHTKHVVFDFTSKVIDFVLIDSKPSNFSHSGESLENGIVDGLSCKPEALVVLADEEIVVIDLLSENWKMMSLPYLVSLHASAITCSQHVSGVPEELWEQLKDAGKAQTNNLYSRREWPIDGGELLCSKGEQVRREILLTGHEDGTIRFWDAGRVNLMPLYKFSTSQLFTGEEIIDEGMQPLDEEEDWPPFRKTGVFDPYSDDPRLAIKRVILCPLSGTLLVAGTAGHLILAHFDTEVLMNKLQVSTMNIVSDRDGFIWKGYDRLSPRTGEIHQPRGFQGTSIIQLHPPAAVTCCTLQADWGLVAAGTAHGLAVFDYKKQKAVLVKCTLNPNDLTGAGDTPISRRKSFKKSLRESFRRLRKGRSTRRTQNATSPTAPQTGTPTTRTSPTDEAFSPLEAKPIERQIEARPVEDSMGSMVRCLNFARTFIISVQNTTPTLWAGTNNGTVYVFTITVPNLQKRDTDDVICQLGKEIQLKHRAPVIGIAVLDGSSKPLPEPLEVEKGVAPLPDTTQPHRVVIASEEQFKIFTLPALKPFCKFKLTAHEGARVRRMAFGTFSCQLPDSETKHTEVDLLCLTNLGDCVVLSVPDLKRQLNAAAVRREDINGISSLVFTRSAEALYLHSSSELQRICLSATHVTGTRCYLALPIGARNEGGIEGDIEGQVHAGENLENQTAIPMVNGIVDSAENSIIDKIDEVRENGDDALHNLTVSSSVGDITIDSVKDHIGSGEDFANRISSSTVSKTTITTITNQGGEVTTSSVTTTTSHADTN